MLFLSILHHYFIWHYTRAFGEIFHVWKNFLWFVVHFFSLPQLMRSWIAPWKRMVEGRGNTWNLEDLAAFVIIGFFSRLIGFTLRSIIIALGLLATLTTLLAGILVYLFWLIAPVAIIVLFGFGIT